MATDDVLIEVNANELKGDHRAWVIAFGLIALAYAGFQIYTAAFGPYIALVQRAVHVCFALVLCTMAYRMKKEKEGPQLLSAYAVDAASVIASIVITAYLVLNVDRLILHVGFTSPTGTDVVLGFIMTFLVLDASRKVVGWMFTWIILGFIAYALLGPWMPDALSHGGYSPDDLAAFLLVNPQGIYGQITGTSANVIAIYVIFGAVMLQTGAAKAFLNIALIVAGRFTGGGAQVAVVASAMMGTVNGSAVANAATVGAFTIPMMVKRGYPRPFAGGVESAASSGGQITPPVMGAGAFIMAEILGLPYFQIAKMAAIPAVLFYVGIMMVVYFEARKSRLPRLTSADIPAWREYLPELLMLLGPTVVLVTLIVMMFTPRYAAFWALSLNVVVFYALVLRRRRSATAPTRRAALKQSNSTIVSGLIEGASTVATLAVLVAGAQIMVGTLGITGLPLKLSQLVLSLGITHLFPLLVSAMVIACVLGGPLPTVPSYLITAAVVVPLFASFKLPPAAIHLFIFYYACFSGLTPPVFGPVYSSAIFAGAGLWETAWESIKCSFIGFLVPFVFVYNTEMLGIHGVGPALEMLALGSAATLLAASAITGFWSAKLSLVQRALLLIAAALMIAPEPTWRVAGLGLGAAAAAWAWFGGRRALPVASAARASADDV